MTENFGQTAYEKIKIFKQTYTLPVLGGESFNALQGNIQQRQEIIKTGKRSERVFFWVKSNKEISFEERFVELDRLVKDYNKLINFLTTHREAYKSFFVSLTDELKEVVTQELRRVWQDEQKRQQLEQKLAQKNTNPNLLNTIQQLKAQNYQTLLMFGNAFLLMLKKVEVISKGIDKLVDDQNTQRRILDQMVQDLDDYREVYKLKKSMDQTRKRAAELVQLAVDLEQILNPVLGQFQGLIDQIVRIDGELNSTVSQVQDLVQNLTGSEGFFNFEGHNQVSDKLLDFLVINEQKKAVLSNALDEAEAKTTDFLLTNYQLLDECVEIDIAIENIQAQVGQQLTKMSGNYRQTIDVSASKQIMGVSNWNQEEVGNENKEDVSLTPIQSSSFVEELSNGVKLEMIAIPAGEFMMGTDDAEIERLCQQYNMDYFKWEKPRHKVRLKEFYMGKYPITQAQYEAVMGENPSHFKDTEKAPLSKGGWGGPIKLDKTRQTFCTLWVVTGWLRGTNRPKSINFLKK